MEEITKGKTQKVNKEIPQEKKNDSFQMERDLYEENIIKVSNFIEEEKCPQLKKNKEEKRQIEQNKRGVYLGSDGFFELRVQSDFIIDKTMLIKSFLESSNKFTAALYPRRFGKTINLDMIRAYVEINYQKSEDAQNINTLDNKNYFMGGDVVLDLQSKETIKLTPLQISNEKALFTKYFGKFSCIYLDFKGVGGNELCNFWEKMKDIFHKEFRRHAYLENSKELTKKERDNFITFANSKPIEKYGSCLETLSLYLEKHWKKKVMVFIDEYDSPITKAHFKLGDKIDNFIESYCNIFSDLLKTNLSIAKAYITGILHLESAGFLSGLNNRDECTVADPGFTVGYYGFTEAEVSDLKLFYDIDEDLYGRYVKEWYNGYVIGEQRIYNPWSVICCLRKIKEETQRNHTYNYIFSQSFKCHWCLTGQIEILSNIFKFPEIKEIIESLLDDFENKRTNFYNLKELNRLSQKQYQILIDSSNKNKILELTPEFIETFFTFLIYAGYLTTENKNEGFYLKIPNEELKKEFQNKIIKYYENEVLNFSPATKSLIEVMNAKSKEIINEKLNNFQNSFSEILLLCPEFIKIQESNEKDEGAIGNEDIIHSLMNVISLFCRNMIIGTEIWFHNKKRCDLILINKSTSICLLMEFKFDGNSKKALNQIIERNYQDILKLTGIKSFKTVICLGVNIDNSKKIYFCNQIIENY